MTSSKEWVKNELSLSDDCLTTVDRIMLNKVLQDLERLEHLEKENQELKEKNSLITKAVESDVSNGELFKSMAMLLHMKIEELKKAIEIIKKKEVNVGFEILGIDSYELYERLWEKNAYDNGYDDCCKLTQEEFSLLKEVLGC